MSQAVPAPVADVPRRVRAARTRADRTFRGIALGAGSVTLVVLFLIGLFLFLRAVPAFQQNGLSFFTTSTWAPDDIGHHAGALALVYGTVEIAVIALVLAVPVSLLTAIFLTEYVSPGLKRPFTSLLDLLAAIPSLIYGIWGFFYLEPHLIPVSEWLAHNLGFLPIFEVSGDNFAGSPFIAGVLVGLMLLPTATSVMREVFSQAPPGEKEAALALGGSRWRMIRAVVIPFGRGGIIGGSMLALGRALGESISVAIVIASAFTVSPHILETGANSIGAHIANRFGDATPTYGLPALMAVGLVLFGMTLLVNTTASLIVRRSRSGAGVEI
jgi:phosphate transport system permease protein